MKTTINIIVFFLLAISTWILVGSKQYIFRVENKKNVVFIYPSWCGVAHELLQKEIAPLSKDTSVNVILVCTSSNPKESIAQLKSYGIQQSPIVLQSIFSGFPPYDRWCIKRFIRSHFSQSNTIDLEGFFFPVPIRFLCDENLIVKSLLSDDIINETLHWDL